MGNFITSRSRASGGSLGLVLGSGLLVLPPAAALAGLIRWLHAVWPGSREGVVQPAGLAGVVGLVLPVGVYLGYRRRAADAGHAGRIVLAALGTVLLAFYLAFVSHHVEFPADILVWSEGDFVNDIVKFRIGYPLYTKQQNNDSFHYTPGAQLLTYALARALGAADSIPTYRLIQVVYCLTAAVVAVCCYWRLTQFSGTSRFVTDWALWGAVALPLFLLISTNSITNPFAHNLHNDALAQLIAVVAYWLLLDYAVTRRRLTLALMALIPALGFFVKQSLAIWILLYGVYLLFFDLPRSAVRVAGYVVVAIASLALLLAGCYGIWGESFWYWTVREQATHVMTPLRSVQHLLDAWAYYVIGLFAGVVFLHGAAARRLCGPWVIWLLFFLAETYTSGIEWALNHMGPGCLLAGIWFLAALTRLCSAIRVQEMRRFSAIYWARTALGVFLICFVYAGLGLIWMPVNPLPADAYRYVREIEREFVGLPADKVLLDVGAWIYARDRLVMKDGAPGIGTRGMSREMGDFSGILGRLDGRHYQKILVRSLDDPAFWYDATTGWRRSSGIRQALRDNYQEVGRIQAVQGEIRFGRVGYEPISGSTPRYGFQEITILAPRSLGGSQRARTSVKDRVNTH